MTESLVNKDRELNGTGLTSGDARVNGHGFTRSEGWELTEDQKLVRKRKKSWWRR